MIIKYQLTFEDFIALQKDFIKYSKYHRTKHNFTILVLYAMAFSGGFLATILALPRTISANFHLSLAVGIGILLAILLTPFIKKYYDFVTLKQYRYLLRNDKRWPRDITLHLHEKGIDMSSVHGEIMGSDKRPAYGKINGKNEVAWGSILELNEDEDRLFLYFDAREAIIIPKSEPILSKAEQEMLRKLLKQHLSSDIVNGDNETPQFLN